jgi:DNA helicase-2/ATP-dependent DNA helicase PcrA
MPIRQQDIDAAVAVQVAAAQDGAEQVRLVAGPGTGKSSTIEERVRYLLESGVDPADIAVVSFTNASVIDLRIRLHSYCNTHGQPGIDRVSITTLHSLALRMLRQAGLLAAYPTRPMVLDNWELDEIYDAEFGVDQDIRQVTRRREIRAFYEAFWSTGREDAATYRPANPQITADERRSFGLFHGPTSQLYSAVLPGEIVRKCVEAAETGVIDPAQLLGITQLIVDEYQDLNPADLQFVGILTAAGVTTFIAGDDDQSIYSFRHASPAGIQDFPARHVGAAERMLEGCFRCTPAVLDAATQVINANAAPGRIAKRLVSLYENAAPANAGIVHRWRFAGEAAEALGIANSCSSLIAAGVAPRDILILLSNKSLWPQLEETMTAAAVPFDPPREQAFVDSAAGRLVLSIARIACSRDDDGHAEDVIAHRTLIGLRVGVGPGTCNSIRRTVIQTPNLAFLDLFERDAVPAEFRGRARTAIEDARRITDAIEDWDPDETIADRADDIDVLIQITTEEANDVAAWREFCAPLPDGTSLKELRDYLWVDTEQKRAGVIKAIRERLGLGDQDIAALNRVRVMTMHSAKGLSAKVVFIPGLEVGLMPNNHQQRAPAQVLEAARLLYVSITRARAACVVSLARTRMVFGRRENRAPSPFATQTGGAFGDGGTGLTVAQTEAIVAAIGGL